MSKVTRKNRILQIKVTNNSARLMSPQTMFNELTRRGFKMQRKEGEFFVVRIPEGCKCAKDLKGSSERLTVTNHKGEVILTQTKTKTEKGEEPTTVAYFG